eukprot:2133185-Rhodomonas_salina.4
MPYARAGQLPTTRSDAFANADADREMAWGLDSIAHGDCEQASVVRQGTAAAVRPRVGYASNNFPDRL